MDTIYGQTCRTKDVGIILYSYGARIYIYVCITCVSRTDICNIREYDYTKFAFASMQLIAHLV